ncbi:MAG: protein kinase [Planctomycetes bacterium]|nr:protein kinase [Planctomycetota bacterium]
MTDLIRCARCGKDYAADQLQQEYDGICLACLVGAAMETEPQETSAPGDRLDPLKPGDTFRNLEILEVLGQGGMGIVYKARQTGLDRRVALKILSPKLAGDPEFARRFTREAKALAILDHPNIVRVIDYGTERNLYYLVMEYVDGVTLRALLNDYRLSPEETLKIVPQICEALEFAHGEGIVHRDIKPENIMVDRRGRIKIADFGLAKMISKTEPPATFTHTNVAMGTPHYMAPEQCENMKQVDHRADIYSLGVVFYEMLTGEVPMGHFLPPSRRVQVDVRLDEIVLKALAREPERRYQRVREVRTDVETVVSQPRVHTDSPRPSTEYSLHPIDNLVKPQYSTPHMVVAFAFGLTFLLGAYGKMTDVEWTEYPVLGLCIAVGAFLILRDKSSRLRKRESLYRIVFSFGTNLCLLLLSILVLKALMNIGSWSVALGIFFVSVYGFDLLGRLYRHMDGGVAANPTRKSGFLSNGRIVLLFFVTGLFLTAWGNTLLRAHLVACGTVILLWSLYPFFRWIRNRRPRWPFQILTGSVIALAFVWSGLSWQHLQGGGAEQERVLARLSWLRLDMTRADVWELLGDPVGRSPGTLDTLSKEEVWAYGPPRPFTLSSSPPFLIRARERSSGRDLRLYFDRQGRLNRAIDPQGKELVLPRRLGGKRLPE